MSDINHVVLVGRLTRDAELKFINTGTAVSKFSIAVNRGRNTDDGWKEEAHFFNIVLWGKRAESLSPYLLKGGQIGVEGELRQNRWKDQETGNSRSTVEIVATNIQLLQRPKGQESSEPIPDGSEFQDDIPFQRNYDE